MSKIEPLKLQRMLSLIKEGKSLNLISKELKLNKSTIYYHYKKIRGRKHKPVILNLGNQETLGEIIGLFAADGNSFKDKHPSYRIRFYLGGNEVSYGNRIFNLLNTLTGRKPYLFATKNTIVIGLRIKKLYLLMYQYLSWNGKKTYTVRLKHLDHSPLFLKGFIRGYFDGDGFSDKDRRRISIVGVSREIMYQIYNVLVNFGFEPQFYFKKEKRSNRKTLYRVILKQEQATQFIKFIQPGNSNRIRQWG